MVHGYEIHHGMVTRDGGEPLLGDEGCHAGTVTGTVWHGLLENDAFRRRYLSQVALLCGRSFVVAPEISFAAVREAKLDRLADLVADHLDVTGVQRLLDGGHRPAPPLRLALEVTPGGAP
jgi:adenosylcobyric acid synthase